MHPATPSDPNAKLSVWDRRGLVLLLVLTVLFGGLVELRSAFLKRRMTDVGVYFRAAWAVRAGEDFYSVLDENHWHYHYPPLLAILLVPLADPPAGVDRAGVPPFAVSVAIWYVFSLLCLAWAVHRLAMAVEATSTGPPVARGGRRWWYLRTLPVVVCLPVIAASLMRGQVDLLLLALLCGMLAALLGGRSGQAGLWLAAAICLKVIPAFLLIYPLWRRDIRCLTGCAAGLVVGLALVPAAALGPQRAVDSYREWFDVLVRPGLGARNDSARDEELIKVTRTDSQSFLAIIHNTAHLNRYTRPYFASSRVRLAHWAVGGGLTLLTLLAAGWRRPRPGPEEVIFVGLLVVLMMLVSPVCHLHYFCLLVPLVTGLIAARWERTGGIRLGVGWFVLLAANTVAHVLVRIPGLDLLRDVGVATYAALLLWLAGCVVLRSRSRSGAASGTAGRACPPLAA